MTADLQVATLRDEIHLWTVDLDGTPRGLLGGSETLSPDELVRARRYRLERDRRRFIAARVGLRHLLARYLGMDPASVRFVSGEHGKPQLASAASSWLRFSASHSESLAVFAVGRDREIGVDIERVREDVDMEPVARRVLSIGERADVDELPPDARRRAFYRSWVRKEAVLKALGDGLAVEPHELDVTEDHVELLTRDGLASLPAQSTTWSLHDVDLSPGYFAALAIKGDLSNPPVVRGSITHALATSYKTLA